MKMCRGFTLLELMVTIAVLAILATIGVPSFQGLIQSNRVTTQTNELVTALNFARTEAIKRGRSVQLEVITDSGWTATVSIAGGGADLRVVAREDSGITLNAATFRFDPTGVLADPVGGGAFEMKPKSGGSDKYRRCISVGPSGQITTTRAACP
jgi:type IV fimbrial biogenesis protein FimT